MEYGRTSNSSQYNTAVGYMAAAASEPGYNNTIIGANSDVAGNSMYNCVLLGTGITSLRAKIMMTDIRAG